jgi:hypothetical protein
VAHAPLAFWEGTIPDAPRIFFSYAGEDGYWVEAFRKSTAFKSIGSVHVLDYAAEEVGYGSLGAALDVQIHRSAVVIAFVSRDYYKKQWTIAEWEQSLTEAQRRRLLFVPIMLDADCLVAEPAKARKADVVVAGLRLCHLHRRGGRAARHQAGGHTGQREDRPSGASDP